MASDPTIRMATPLEEALSSLNIDPGFARQCDAALTSAIRASVPGRQKGKNLAPLMDAARKAFVRTLRRRARAHA